MLPLKTVTHNGHICYFDETEHKYFVKDTILLSATRFIGSFFPTFESNKIAAKYAKKHGLKKKDVLAAWAAKGEYSSEKGHALHLYAENKLLGMMTPFLNKEWLGHAQAIDRVLAILKSSYEVIGVEQIIFSLTLGLSGTIDLLLKKKKAENEYLILDWKTNEDIDSDNSWRHGLPPISHLDDCNYEHYALQGNIYERILIEENYFPNATYKKVLVHLQEEGIYRLHRIGDYQKDVEGMISWI